MPPRKGQTCVFAYPDWCKGCGLCVAFCPAKVFELGPTGKVLVAHEEECINCGFCELHCPDFAIAVLPKGEDGSCSADLHVAQEIRQKMKGHQKG